MDVEEKAIIRELKARADIQATLVRAARGLDRLDRELALSAYHEDGWDAHGSFEGPAADFVDWALVMQGNHFQWTSHYLSNVHIELQGETAAVETYVRVMMRFERDGGLFDLWGCGRYLDAFACRDGQWKIVHRRVVGDWSRIDPVIEQMDQAVADALPRGTRDRQDPSYALFGTATETRAA